MRLQRNLSRAPPAVSKRWLLALKRGQRKHFAPEEAARSPSTLEGSIHLTRHNKTHEVVGRRAGCLASRVPERLPQVGRPLYREKNPFFSWIGGTCARVRVATFAAALCSSPTESEAQMRWRRGWPSQAEPGSVGEPARARVSQSSIPRKPAWSFSSILLALDSRWDQTALEDVKGLKRSRRRRRQAACV